MQVMVQAAEPGSPLSFLSGQLRGRARRCILRTEHSSNASLRRRAAPDGRHGCQRGVLLL